jgi:hypothetical protein
MSAGASAAESPISQVDATEPDAFRRARRWWPWAPLAAAVVYAVALLATLRSFVAAIYSSADTVSAPYIGELYAHAPHGAQVVLGDIPWYTTLWFESLTRSFPAHRQLWELAPWIVAVLGIGLVGWSASKVAGRWAGMIVAVTLACSGPALLSLQFGLSVHALAYVHVCVLGAFGVLLAHQSGLIGGRRWMHTATLTAVVLVTGAGIASDKLVTVAGLVPFAVACAALAWLSSPTAARRIVASAAAVTVGSILLADVIGALMRHEHVVAASFPIGLSDWNKLANHAGLLVQSLTVLMNGDFGGADLSVRAVLSLTSAAILVLAAYWAARYVRGFARELVAQTRGTGGLTPQAATRAAYVTYWASSALILIFAYVFSTVAVDVNTKRYVVTIAYGIIALAAVASAGRTSTKLIATAGACIIVAASVTGLLGRDLQRQLTAHPSGAVASQLLRWARSEHLMYGYAGYWDAAPLTWEMHSQVQVYPVWTCPDGRSLCPFTLHRISSWYRPRAGARTFLVIDARQTAANTITSLSSVASLGKPEQTVTLQQLTILVYPYDIASRFETS